MMDQEPIQSETPQPRLIKSIRPQTGHFVFEFNKVTEELKLAIIAIMTDENKKILGKKVDIKNDCVYCTALNKKNAARQFSKMLQKEIKPNKIKHHANTNPVRDTREGEQRGITENP